MEMETVYDPKRGTILVLTREMQQQLREAKEVGKVGKLTAPVIIETATGGVLLATGDTIAILEEVPHGDATVATDPGRAGRVLRRVDRRGELESDTPDTQEAGG